MSDARSIAGGLGTPVKHGTMLPTNAAPFTIFLLTLNPLRPQLYVSNADGEWLAILEDTQSLRA